MVSVLGCVPETTFEGVPPLDVWLVLEEVVEVVVTFEVSEPGVTTGWFTVAGAPPWFDVWSLDVVVEVVVVGMFCPVPFWSLELAEVVVFEVVP